MALNDLCTNMLNMEPAVALTPRSGSKGWKLTLSNASTSYLVCRLVYPTSRVHVNAGTMPFFMGPESSRTITIDFHMGPTMKFDIRCVYAEAKTEEPSAENAFKSGVPLGEVKLPCEFVE